MTPIKVLFLGQPKSGKSFLINRFREGTFERGPSDNSGAFFSLATKNKIRFRLWDIDERVINTDRGRIELTNAKATDVCAYTLDLSAPLDEEAFARNIAMIREANPSLPIILVGCKSDLVQKVDLDDLRRKYKINQAISTSAQSGEGIDELTNSLIQVGLPNKIEKIIAEGKPHQLTISDIKKLLAINGPLYQAIENLEKLMKGLPLRQATLINEAIIQLVIDLYQQKNTSEQPNPEQAINDFLKKSSDVLATLSRMEVAKDLIRRTHKGILLVTAAAIITIFAATILFNCSLPAAAILFSGIVVIGVGALFLKARLFPPIPKALDKIAQDVVSDDSFSLPPYPVSACL